MADSARLGRFVVTGTLQQVASIQAGLDACRYPAAQTLTQDIPVSFADLTSQQALGLFWTSGSIQIEQTLPPSRASQVFLAEAWHAVDQYLLTNADRVSLMSAAHGSGPDGHTWFDNASYYENLGETTMDVFLAAFTDYPPTGINWGHPVTALLTETLRGILMPTPTPPTPPPPPPPPPPPAAPPVVPPVVPPPPPPPAVPADCLDWARRTVANRWRLVRDRKAAQELLDWAKTTGA